MEVYIDNVRVEMKQKTFKSLGKAIFEINKKLDKENKVLHKIYVNGSTLKDDIPIVGKDLKVIEVITRSHGELILEAILDAKEYIDGYFDSFDALETDGQDIISDEDEMQLVEMLSFSAWFCNLLGIIKESHFLDFIYEDFEEYFEEFDGAFSEANKAYEERDFFTLINIFEFTIGELLGEFYDNLDEYYNDIAEEENRKRLLN